MITIILIPSTSVEKLLCLNSMLGRISYALCFFRNVVLLHSGASSLEKRVCCGRAAFEETFQPKTTFSLKTRKRPMNFVMLQKYHIGKILPIYSMSAIFSHKS